MTAERPHTHPPGPPAPPTSPQSPVPSNESALQIEGSVSFPTKELLTEQWNGDVPHLFFHPLIVNPEMAFDGDRFHSFMHKWFVTKEELLRILEELYARDYVLVDFYDSISYESGGSSDAPRAVARRTSFAVPAGKKPLIISIDDLNYYPDTTLHGGALGLVIDVKGQLMARVPDGSGGEELSNEGEIPLLLERFIEKHPDFSWRGGRGIIGLTAYNGFLGYRTNDPHNSNRDQDSIKARDVANALKAMGWHFACHSWGHIHPGRMSATEYRNIEERWQREAAPIIGSTDLFIFPFGALPFDDPGKLAALQDLGYRVLFPVDRNYTSYDKDGSLVINRIQMDGLVLSRKTHFILPFVDPSRVSLHPFRFSIDKQEPRA